MVFACTWTWEQWVMRLKHIIVNASADAVWMHQWAQEENHRTASASIGCGELTHEKEEKLLVRSQCSWTLIREKPSMHCVRFRRLEEWTLNSWVRSDVEFCSTSNIEGRHKMCSFQSHWQERWQTWFKFLTACGGSIKAWAKLSGSNWLIDCPVKVDWICVQITPPWIEGRIS